MKFLLTILSLLITSALSAQMGMMMAWNTARAPKYGILLENAGDDPAEKADIAKNNLGLNWYRSRINAFSGFDGNDAPISSGFPGWDGSANAWEDPAMIGLMQIMQINVYPPGQLRPYLLPAYQDEFAAICEDVYDTYGDPNGIEDIEIVALDNEQQTQTYHRGDMADYANTLHTMWNVFHPKGVKCTDGGIIHGVGLRIKTYQYVRDTYGTGEAAAFASNSGMSPHQVRYANGIDSDALFDEFMYEVNTILNARLWVDYFNFHYYEDPDSPSETNISPNELRYQKEYIEAVGKRPTLSNENGQRNNDQPLLLTNLMKEFYRHGTEYVQAWSGEGPGGAVPFTNAAGVPLPNGEAFRDWILAHKHREWYGPLP